MSSTRIRRAGTARPRMIIASIDDYRKKCQARLPRFLYDYISGGSYQENALRANIADLQGTLLRQRVMVDESHLNLSIQLWDQSLSLPVVLKPVGMAGMYSSRGEVKAANAAKSVGVPFTRQERDRAIRFRRFEGVGIHCRSCDPRQALQRGARRDGEGPDISGDAGLRRSRRDAPPLGPRYRH